MTPGSNVPMKPMPRRVWMVSGKVIIPQSLSGRARPIPPRESVAGVTSVSAARTSLMMAFTEGRTAYSPLRFPPFMGGTGSGMKSR